MAVRHGVKDTDTHFIIDPVTRTIKNQSGKLVLIQYDHNSERFTFECPRLVDDHDMSLCDRVEIHYINTGINNSKTTGVYEVDDLQVSPDNNNVVTCSWLISQNATQHVGKLNFVIRFACIAEDSTVEYAWNTAIYSDIVISKSIYNGEEFIENYIDVLEMWKKDLYAGGLKFTSVKQTTTSTEDEGINIVTMSMTDGSTETIQIRNGSKGSKGDMGIYIASIERTSGDGSEGSTDTYSINMSNGAVYTFPVYHGKDAVSISSIERTSGDGSEGSTDTYTISMSDGTSSTFPVYNGADGKDAVSISSIKRTSGDGSEGSTDTYTISMSDGTSSTFQVYHGADGSRISSIERTSGNGSAGTIDTYTVNMTDGSTSSFQVYNGANGRSISSIERTSGTGAAGTSDTYTVTFNDNSTFDFFVYNGADGEGAGDMLKTIYDPQNKNVDIFAYIDNKVGQIDSLLDSINGE